jgi:Tol biopolymer transport system component
MAVWSPDSTRLVCESAGPATRLFMIDVASGRARLLDHASSFSGVAFSPGGDRIAWARQRGNSVAVFDLYVAPAAGGPSRRLLPNAFSPAWGPELIAVTRIKPRGVSSFPLFSVWLLRPDGSGLRQLTHRREPQLIGGLVPLQWSADGSRLLGQRSGEDYAEAYRIDPRTGAASDLTGRDDGVTADALSADGRAVLATRGGFEPTTGNDVVVIPWAGGRARVVARHAFSPTWTR